MNLSNITLDSAAPFVVVGLVITCALLCVAAILESLNDGRKQRQREREVNELMKDD